jgi:hypothetical protein
MIWTCWQVDKLAQDACNIHTHHFLTVGEYKIGIVERLCRFKGCVRCCSDTLWRETLADQYGRSFRGKYGRGGDGTEHEAGFQARPIIVQT